MVTPKRLNDKLYIYFLSYFHDSEVPKELLLLLLLLLLLYNFKQQNELFKLKF